MGVYIDLLIGLTPLLIALCGVAALGWGRLPSRRLRFGLLTNSVREWEPHRAAMLTTAGRSDAAFDAVMRSHEVAKPDEAMFALAEATFNARPEQCLLIDDMTDNCPAARRRGWTAVAHLDTDRTITALTRFARADAQQQPEPPTPNT